MNWVKLVLIVIIIGVFLALFGSTIGDTVAEIDFTLLDEPISVIAEVINGFIITFDTASATFPLTIQTIMLIAGLGIAGYVVRRVIKSE